MRLDLQDITLCAVDCVTPRLAHRAIQKSLEACRFGRAILFTSDQMEAVEDCQVVQINPLKSIHDYSHFLIKELGAHIQTPFVLIIQWDGYVIDPRAWDDEFLRYDYIGAKWEWHRDGKNIGNGGFSLRSKRLLDATSSANFSFLPHVNEDEQICRVQRDFLSKIHSIQFAPENVADRFSYERTLPNAPTFGFHGLFNMWRHLEDGEMMNLVDGLTVRTHQSREFAELMVQYFLLRKFKPLEHMYRKIKATQSKSDFSNHIARLTNNVQFSIDFADLCEKLTSEADRFGRSL